MLDRVPRDPPSRRRAQRGPARDRWLKLGLCLAACGLACLARFEVGDASSGDTQAGSGTDAGNSGEGTAEGGGCDPNDLICDGVCVDGQIDPANCGQCGHDCSSGQSCELGQCVEACSPACDPIVEQCVGGECACREDFTPCGGLCVDLNSDPQNCGTCSESCDAAVCDGGECQSQCDQEKTDCDGACVNPDNDPLHCGSCETACGGDELCVDGQCYGYDPIACETDSDCNVGVCCEIDEEDKVCLYGDQCP